MPSTPPPVPQHNTSPRVDSRTPQARRPGAPSENGLRRNSAYSGRRQSLIGLDPMDDDAKILRESIAASRKLNDPSYSPKVRDSWALPSNANPSYKVDSASVANWPKSSSEDAPRANPAQPSLVREDSLFDNQISESAILGQRFAETNIPSPVQKQAPQNKVMTPAQFERYKQDQERMRSVGGQSKDVEEDEDEDEIYDDEEDELERKKELAKQRRKQEAHMAVYRQQMMKVTGETPSSSTGPPSLPNSALGRPGLFAAHSTPNLMSLGIPDEGEEEDEEVPLAILQAHGFPSKGKPPMRTSGSNPNLRAPSAMGGALPVFARHLPEDPYYGAGIVNPMHRESMAFGGGSPNGSPVNGGSPRGVPSGGVPPGGLVGVIATEERSRAMRRGSPNQQGNYGTPVGFDGMSMGMHNSPSMMNGMNSMPMMMDPAQMQMTAQMQQMQQFMQVQMHFMQMMSQGQGQQNGQMLMPGQEFQRPSSAQGGAPQLRPQSSHQRAMTMMDPNSAPWLQPGGGYAPSMNGGGLGLGGYAPSIAPSERSNIGLPGRYRPVSHAPLVDSKSRASTMSGALQGWENRNGQATIKTVTKRSENVSDDDDDEGWEQMKKAKEKKKSMWRIKKDTSSNILKDMAAFTH
jgi:hypothetical protein